MPVKFGNPPIHEMVIGARFAPQLRALRSEHIGLLWSRLGRKDFPTVHQKPPLDVPIPSATEFLPMPRFWLESKAKDKLIQVQKNAFLLNWRKRETEYPHFAEQLKPEFDRCFEIFEAFVHEDVYESEIRIERCELTYLDLIRPCEYWGGPKDTHNVIPSFAAPARVTALDADASFDCNFFINVAPDLRMQVGIRVAEDGGDPPSPLLALEFNAWGEMDGVVMSDTKAWYKQAHDAIIDCFLRMTSAEIQKKYWLKEGTYP